MTLHQAEPAKGSTKTNKLGDFAVDQVHQTDALEALKRLPDKSVDLVVTDPPFNIASAQKSTIKDGRIQSTKAVFGDWDTFHPFDFDIFIMRIISECYRILEPGGALYLFTAREQNGYFIRKAVERGFTYRNTIAVVKQNPLPSFAKSNWRSGFELCMYLTKGKPAGFNFGPQNERVNVMSYPTAKRETTHPTEKPLFVIQRFIEASSNAGDIVLDPFMGSGTTAVAALRLGRRFLGFEQKAEYVMMAKERIRSMPCDASA